MRRRKEPGRIKGCPVCTGVMDETGFCVTGKGYPITKTCHFMCPFCRQELTWDGACIWCHGTHTKDDRSTWSFPGDEYHVQHGHWVKVAGPQMARSVDENTACQAVVQQVLDKKLSEKEAQARIHGILHPEVPV